MTPTTSLYIPVGHEHTWKRFQEIARREGKTANALIVDFIAEYVELHDPGNPQARITSYGEGGPVDAGVIEGRIREHFRSRDALGFDVLLSDVIELCRERLSDRKAALAMAERVSKWLHERGAKVWR